MLPLRVRVPPGHHLFGLLTVLTVAGIYKLAPPWCSDKMRTVSVVQSLQCGGAVGFHPVWIMKRFSTVVVMVFTLAGCSPMVNYEYFHGDGSLIVTVKASTAESAVETALRNAETLCGRLEKTFELENPRPSELSVSLEDFVKASDRLFLRQEITIHGICR